METDSLRKHVKKLMIDADLDKKGDTERLAKELDINQRSLYMALSGYRTGPASEGYLIQLQEHLTELIKSQVSSVQ